MKRTFFTKEKLVFACNVGRSDLEKYIRNQHNCEQYNTDENFCIFSDCM